MNKELNNQGGMKESSANLTSANETGNSEKPTNRQQKIESEMIVVIQKFLAWGGIETSVEMFFDLFAGMSNEDYNSKHIYDVGWEMMRTLSMLTRLYQLNEQREAAISDLKNTP